MKAARMVAGWGQQTVELKGAMMAECSVGQLAGRKVAKKAVVKVVRKAVQRVEQSANLTVVR